MSDHMPEDLSAAGRDVRAFTDELRPRHPIVRNEHGDHVLLRHAEVRAVALDDVTFSNAVSAHLHVPNGMDGAEHDAYRAALDPFLSARAITPLEPVFRRIAAELVAWAPRGMALEAVSQIGARFAVRAQSAWLGWSADLEQPLVEWVRRNHAATRSGDRARTKEVADEFDDLIGRVLDARRSIGGDVLGDDVTARLMRTRVQGRRLTDAEVTSVLRNWTGGDLGSIALCVGVLLHDVATQPVLQDRLRAGVPDAEWDAVIDELLRIDDPFVTNRRVTTCPVTVAGVALPAGARVKLNWTSANRDEAVFGDPDRFDPEGNAPHNLVYGIGRHACPGRLLATIELRVALQEFLAATTSIRLADEPRPHREEFPVGGWADVAVVLA